MQTYIPNFTHEQSFAGPGSKIVIINWETKGSKSVMIDSPFICTVQATTKCAVFETKKLNVGYLGEHRGNNAIRSRPK